MNRAAAAYPWDALRSVSKRAVRPARRLRRALRAAADIDAVARALGALVGADAKIVVRDVSPSEDPPGERAVHLSSVDSAVLISIEPDAALASALLSRILERSFRLVDGEAPLSAPLRGALAALAVEVARRTGTELVSLGNSPEGAGVRIRVTLFLDERPYGLSLWAVEGPIPTREPRRNVRLGEIGDVQIDVPLVAAASAAPLGEMSAVSLGDIWMPGAGWFGQPSIAETARTSVRALIEQAVVAAPSGEYGVAVDRSDDGRFVLGGTVVALVSDEVPRFGGDDSNMSEQKDALDSVVLDSPVVVRVEVGTVSLTARQWAAVEPGDVLETGVRIAESVVLRIAGREVARGELVNIDGELGVRIVELIGPGRST